MKNGRASFNLNFTNFFEITMNNSISEKQSSPDVTYRTGRTDYDIAEVAIGFGREFGNQSASRDFRSSTLGSVTFRRVDPLREPFQVADRRLQTRLEALCETLRAKY